MYNIEVKTPSGRELDTGTVLPLLVQLQGVELRREPHM